MTRIDNIRNYAETQGQLVEKKERATEALREKLIGDILTLSSRIKELIETGIACLENNICIDAYGVRFDHSLDSYECGTFVTNGITHRLGFYTIGGQLNKQIVGIGIENGGACGNVDLKVTPENVSGEIHGNFPLRAEPRIRDMKDFLEHFDEFETAFYKYVDNIVS